MRLIFIGLVFYGSYNICSAQTRNINTKFSYPIPISEYSFKHNFIGLGEFEASSRQDLKYFDLVPGISYARFQSINFKLLPVTVHIITPQLEVLTLDIKWERIIIRPGIYLGYSIMHITNRNFLPRNVWLESGFMIKLDFNVLYNLNDRINIGLGSSLNVILMPMALTVLAVSKMKLPDLYRQA